MNELVGNVEGHQETMSHINTLEALYTVKSNLTLNFWMNIGSW